MPIMRLLTIAVLILLAAASFAQSVKTYDSKVQAVAPSAQPSQEKIYDYVEEMPQFPGGEIELLKWVASHVKYPVICQEKNIQGRVVVQFVVKKDGSIGHIKVVRPKDPDLDKEAIRVIRSLPMFTPGRQNGVPVNVWYHLPITFKLQGDEPTEAISEPSTEDIMSTQDVEELYIIPDDQITLPPAVIEDRATYIDDYSQVNESSDNIIMAPSHTVKIESPLLQTSQPDADKVYDHVKQMPMFPGGEVALLQWVSSHIQYPQSCQENNIQGRVLVQFVVKKDGSIGQVKVVRPKHPDLDKEAIRIVKSLPLFTPGQQDGIPANVWYTLPITFKLAQ